jgi:hypothetical protein
MEVGDMKVPEKVDGRHHVMANGIPTMLVEGPGETVRTGGLVAGQLFNSLLDLLLGEGVAKSKQIRPLKVKSLPYKVIRPGRAFTHHGFKVVKDDRFLMRMIGDPTIVKLQTVDVILSFTPIDLHVEKLRIGIPFLYVSYPSALFFASPFDNRKAHNLPFEHVTQVALFNGEGTGLLGNIQLENDEESGMMQHLVVGEETSAPQG